MSTLPLPPDTYRTFVQRYPKIAEGWEAIASAGKEGPLGEKTARLIKLAVACAALREGTSTPTCARPWPWGLPGRRSSKSSL